MKWQLDDSFYRVERGQTWIPFPIICPNAIR